MWKLIINNLWSRRKRNGWLLAELILVSVVTWVIMDPVVVLLHDTSLPLGYDANRLYLIEMASLDSHAQGYDEQASDSASRTDNFFRLMNKIRNYPGIESASPLLVASYLNSQGNSSRGFQVDSLSLFTRVMYFNPGQHYFETYGIKAIPGSPSAEELSKADYGEHDIVVTRNFAESLLPGKQAIGQQVFYVDYTGDTIYYRIAGVVENIRAYSGERASLVTFWPHSRWNIGEQTRVLVRLKPGISSGHFMNEFRPWMVKELRAGNLFARSVISYPQLIKNYEYQWGTSNKIRLNAAVVIFFLINLCLGVIGTFWLQTRKRSEEAGIMRSFGATPGYIMRMLLGEGFVLCTLAFVMGCLGYLQYALKEGLYGVNSFMSRIADDDWISSFETHFLGVSLIVYIIILVVVLIGIYLPARNISRVNPVDALRDE
ncbi:ABC transporter permease [Phocaeicola sp.]